MKRYLVMIVSAALLTACGVSVSYVGKSYAPVQSVDLWFDWRDVPCDFETMGHIDASPGLFTDIEDAQAAIEARAREAGADAVVFEGVRRNASAPEYKTTERSEKNIDGSVTRTTTTTKEQAISHTLMATFIKYKRP